MEQPIREVKDNFVAPKREKISYRHFLLYSVLVIIIVIAAVSVIAYFKSSNRGGVTGNSAVKNEVKENNLSITERPKSEIAKFSESASDGIYKLVNSNGDEVDIRAEQLLQNGLYYKNRESAEIYYINFTDLCSDRKIYKLVRLEGIKSDDVFVYAKDGRYARDSKNVYLDEAQTNFSCAYYYKLRTLPGADPDTFEPSIVAEFSVPQGNTSQGLYSRDSKTVFYGYEVVEEADPGSFKVSKNASITSDKNHVFLRNKIIPGVDPSTYSVVIDYSADGPGTVIGKDKNSVFVDFCLLNGVDAASFSIVEIKSVVAAIDSSRDVFSDKSGAFKIKEVGGENGGVASCEALR